MSEYMKVQGGLLRKKNSKWWYGRYQMDGKRKEVNLHVEIRDEPPDADKAHGNIQFEKSKTEAEVALKGLLVEINGSKNAEELAQVVYQARTGKRVKLYEIADLPDLWLSMPRSKPVSDAHKQVSLSWISGFVEYCRGNLPAVTKLDHLMTEHAQQFMAWHDTRGISPRTWNAILGTLRAACRRGGCKAFDDFKQKSCETVHRVPYSPKELKDILDEARKDELLYPLVVTAACTAMRRGDCCNLKWSSIDLKAGFIKVKTSKTGRIADIPMPDMLRDLLKEQVGTESNVSSC